MNLLEVVNDNDEVIDLKSRAEIHALGLRHREVHVWLVTSDGKVVFQRRSSSKESYPDMLDATAGGHVEPGQTYLEAALAELVEETGIIVASELLIEICKIDKDQQGGGIHNRVFRMIYFLPWYGELSDLQIENGDGAGFEFLSLLKLLNLTPESSGEIIPGLFTPDYLTVWKDINQYLTNNHQPPTTNS